MSKKRSNLPAIVWLFIAILALPPATEGQCRTGAATCDPDSRVLDETRHTKLEDDTFWVQPGNSGNSYWISTAELVANDLEVTAESLVIVRETIHGELVASGPGFSFTPDEEFWSLGTDHFVYGVSGRQSTATVRLLHRFPQQEVRHDGNGVPVEGQRAQLPPARAPEGDTTDDGSATMLGCNFSDLPGGGFGETALPPIAILTVGPENLPEVEDASLRVVVRKVSSLPEMRVELRNTQPGPLFETSEWLPIPRDMVRIGVQWWRSGAILDIDGQTTSIHQVPNGDLSFTRVRIGLMPLDSLPAFEKPIPLEFEQLRIFEYAENPDLPLLRADGFEHGQTADWDASYGSGLTLGAPALTGRRSLRIDLGTGSSFVTDNTPKGVRDLGARFRLDVSDLGMALGDSLQILDSGSAIASPYGAAGFGLRLLGEADGTYLEAYSKRARGVARSVHHLLAGEHLIEVQFRSSATELQASGLLRLWLDGEPIGEVESTSHELQELHRLRFGALGVDPGSSGVLRLDDFETWTQPIVSSALR